MSGWMLAARRAIAEVHASLPPDATLDERKTALKAASPFGERSMWPYKAWLKARREYLAKFFDPAALEKSPLWAASEQKSHLRPCDPKA